MTERLSTHVITYDNKFELKVFEILNIHDKWKLSPFFMVRYICASDDEIMILVLSIPGIKVRKLEEHDIKFLV